MSARADLFLTALAPVIWGSSYIVSTEFLPGFPPMTLALLRVLPTGLFLLLIAQRLPEGIWIPRILVLGALNFTIFQSLLFVSAYRLPGGVAATVGAVQPLLAVFIAAALLKSGIRASSVWAALVGLAGVALLILTPNATLDPVGVAAGLAGAASMGGGVVLPRTWRPSSPIAYLHRLSIDGGRPAALSADLDLRGALPGPDRRKSAGTGLARTGGRGSELRPVVSGPRAAGSRLRLLSGIPQSDDRHVARMALSGPDPDPRADRRRDSLAGGLWIGRCSAEVHRT